MLDDSYIVEGLIPPKEYILFLNLSAAEPNWMAISHEFFFQLKDSKSKAQVSLQN